MRRFPWLDHPMSLDYMVMHCAEEAAGCVPHFKHQIEREKGAQFESKQISGALQRLKKKGFVQNRGGYWSAQ